MLRSIRIAVALVILILAGTAFLAARPATAAPQGGNTWTGTYYNNTTLSGNPAFARDDTSINFDWGLGSPAPGVNADNFSVRWTRYYYIPTAGNYTFTMTSDDGSRLFVDGNRIIGMWYDHSALTRSATIYLSQGYHHIRMLYYDRTYSAVAKLSIAPAGGSFPDWKGEYFNNQYLSGSPTLTRNDTSIDFNWGSGSPHPSIPADHFSVRWTRSQNFNAGMYRITATTDDGMRVFVDGGLIIDAWRDQSASVYQRDISLPAGTHRIRVEYYENLVNAEAHVSITQITPTNQGWTGWYYPNLTFSGAPAFVRTDREVNFNWGTGSPGPGIPADNFSVKWDEAHYVSTGGWYTAYVTSDDGVRLWVDGNLVIDAWYDQSANVTHAAHFYWGPGQHTCHIEYYERGYGAQIHQWLVRD